ncbi:hypothetical protein WAI453_000307 [Rhynchosporium graminicola]|uniref:Related to OMA1 Metalloendopeptidase of the mitochondrial inner membrane, involved in turnover of membrane-embedded proteins n=1 Tax=Rhynchosporium graminicola TaxID=2792576 RepID=A0A1E1JQJ4_9HELO|nr:related to OMA1 Metalloendopeptidase of the mitochondrial inner membrane, involved in turnover of membrane-embedded proteins [Rhynchosporium commune]
MEVPPAPLDPTNYPMMLSRRLLSSSTRLSSRATSRALPRAPVSCFPRSTFTPRRYQSEWNRFPPPPPPQRKPPRIVHYKYDPGQIQHAKPLITTEQISRAVRSSTSKWVFIVAGGSATIFYVANLEEVPVSGRKRFNCYSDATVEEEGRRMYDMIMQENARSILPDWDRRVKMVHRVMAKLIPSSGLENADWEVHVIQSPECNAFVIPGGKVFVYTGILPVAKNDDGLAAILGHEIAHNVARHASESMSSMVMLAPLRFMFLFLDSTGYTMGLGRVLGDMAMDLGLARPASRKQESEADYIGLMMMARSCYNPQEAVKVWQRMEIAQKDQDMPEWLSTHPSNNNRITQMQQWLPKAEAARNESECAVTMGYADDFKTAFRSNSLIGMFR